MTIDLATINFIPGQGGGGVIKSLSVTSNGVYSVPAGVDGYNPVDVDVHPSESLQRTYTSNGNYNITGEFNGGVITVDVPAPQFVTETLNVSANGTYIPSEGVNGYSQVNVNVPVPQFVTETLSVSANGTYNPGQGIDGYSQVVVDVPIDGWDQKSVTEGTIEIINLDNSASFVISDVFGGNKTIQTVNLPYATNVGNRAFQNCNKLSQVNLPMCMNIGDNAFYFCGSLSQVSLPMCSTIGWDAFQGCDSLSQISLPMCSYIGGNAFFGCSLLSIITIGYSSVCRLDNSNVFGNTQITSSTGSIYVPASLVESYKSATNWTYFSDKIVGI